MASPPGTPPSAAAAATKHISRGYERLIQLRAILLSSPPDKVIALPAAINLLDKALGCLAAALSELQAITSCRVNASAGAGAMEGNKAETNLHKRKKIQSWAIVTSVPHFDGHQWRKYGQKHIDRTEFPRSYFKCTYRNDQGCPATKTVQKKEGGDAADPPNYEVRYRMQHTCKPIEAESFPFIMDSSVVLNRSKTPNCSQKQPVSGDPYPEQPLPALLPLNVSNFMDDCSQCGAVHFKDPMLHPSSTEPQRDVDGGGEGSWSPCDNQQLSPGELDFDWERLVGCNGELDAILL